jgi:hypothetical protein
LSEAGHRKFDETSGGDRIFQIFVRFTQKWASDLLNRASGLLNAIASYRALLPLTRSILDTMATAFGLVALNVNVR